MRHNLIDLIDREGMTCRDAAERLGMPYNTAKVIKRVWKKEGRVRAVPPHLKRMFAWYKRDRDELRQRKGNTRKFRELMAFISQLENDPAGLPTLYKSRRKVPPSV
jgi:hypothetical protein